MTQPPRVALAGTGYIAHYHARAAKEAGAELVAVFAIDEAQGERFTRIHGPMRVHTSAADLFADAGVDVVVVALPNALHAPVVIGALRAGKHVLVEKPMAMNAAEATEMLRAAREHDRRLLVGHQWRFDREALYLRARIAAGEIGRVVKTRGYGIHVNWGPAGWFVDPALAGGGALIDMGVHALDTVRFLLGDPQPVSVAAVLGTHFGDYEVDDTGVLMVRWSDGAVSIVESGWWHPHMDGPEASTQLVGTSGYAHLFPTQVVRVVGHKPVEEAPPEFPARREHCDQHTYTGQMVELLAAIADRRDPSPGPEHGLAIMRICDAAYEAARTGRTVEIA